ncbi:sulfatase [uncultured Clostridium sp.]|uniref:sulfatase n=1 Tax=uncultured Clostridium sp. TaxID=59620 RepID=UPI0028E91242|nr:sulfatase [uncultured Clostridium sp.]
MKAIMIMFDTLRRRALPAYGNDWIKAPNFKRLQEKTVTFDNFYAGSLPCMPARRELHTGRYNFLHRSWGPLEPFDDSMPEILKNKGIYTHLVTDHSHYFEDGGCTYHNRYNSWEGFRGQEGDRWKAHIGNIEIPEQLETVKSGVSFKQNWVNRMYQQREEDLSAYKTFEAGMDFIEINKSEDNWFLQIECFDPHEPFYTPQEYKDLYPHEYKGKYFDWPSYQPVTENSDSIEHVNFEYAALVSMCDSYLGKILDYMDNNDMWKDTMLIVNTDHGLLMGEHEWWGKNVQPMYDEISHTPFFIWDPRLRIKNERREALSQTIDIAPTLLEYFNVNIPDSMQGKVLKETICNDKKIRDGALFGVHGGHINVTNGKYVYMRSSKSSENKPLFEYTLMPTVMRNFFSKNQLKEAKITDEFEFTKNIPMLKTPASTYMSSFRFGNKLFNIEEDPNQLNNIDDLAKEIEMLELLRKLMIESEAPKEQFERIGICKDRALTREELILQREKRKENEDINVTSNVEMSNKVKLKLNVIKDLLEEKDKKVFIQYINDMCMSKNIKVINGEMVLKIANTFFDKLNLGDKKQMVINLIKFADKVD